MQIYKELTELEELSDEEKKMVWDYFQEEEASSKTGFLFIAVFLLIGGSFCLLVNSHGFRALNIYLKVPLSIAYLLGGFAAAVTAALMAIRPIQTKEFRNFLEGKGVQKALHTSKEWAQSKNDKKGQGNP